VQHRVQQVKHILKVGGEVKITVGF